MLEMVFQSFSFLNLTEAWDYLKIVDVLSTLKSKVK